MSKIVGDMAGCYSPLGKTFILTDEEGTEITGVVTEQEQVFSATDNDVREGSIYASDYGVSIGTKVIPSYHTAQGSRYIPSGSTFDIPLEELNMYDYTELQALICRYNTSMCDSVQTEKVVISDSVYNVSSTDVLATVVKNSETKTISFEITNNENDPFVLRYFTYKEIY